MKVICGLGNPGREYERHRHNIGFQVVEALGARWKASAWQSKFDAECASTTVGDEKVLLLKPQGFMNRSGLSLGPAVRFYKVEPADVLVIHDELDLPFARLQLKQGGGTGGHNGLNSIADSWGEDAYGRLRFGIDKPLGPNAQERVVGHVLGPFSGEEQKLLAEAVVRAAGIAEGWAKLGMATAMNRFNRR
jgi:PTH1 family peptidyl-tRNA hydrolase